MHEYASSLPQHPSKGPQLSALRYMRLFCSSTVALCISQNLEF